MSKDRDLDAELAEATAELKAAQAEAEALSQQERSTETSLVHVGSSAMAVKREMAQRRSQLDRARKTVLSQQERVKGIIKAKKDEMDALARSLEMELAPVREQIALLEEGIQTINLYLGRDESFEILIEGEAMPASEPLVVRQMTLYMDEEVAAVDDDEGDGIHSGRISWFDEWIKEPGHLEQVLPERKAIVALEPRRHLRKSGQDSKKDNQTYWLIRNGGNLYRMLTDATTFGDNSGFRVGERIVPEREEFTSFFEIERSEYVDGKRVTWTEPMKPGTKEWLAAEKAAGAHQRHYMKIALVLQGLIDRTTVFHPLPPEGLSFLGPESYDSGAIKIITDAELALGTGLEPFYEWLRRLNGELKVGMRIVGNFNGHNLEPYDRQYSYRDGYRRLNPSNASLPSVNEVHVLDKREGSGGFRFKYKRTDQRYGMEHGDWGRWGDWPYKQRASCLIDVTDKFIIPFDLVTIEELERYLAARTERHAYASMFPAIKECIAAKLAEREAEAPMRTMLAGLISTETGIPIPEVEEALPEIVDWYKLKNRWHRPLVTDDQKELAKATRMIVAEFKNRQEAKGNEGEEAAQVSKLRLAHPSALLIGRRKDGTYTTFVPEQEGTPWVAEYKTSKTGRSTTEVKRWGLVGNGWRNWRVLYASPDWKGWDLDSTDRVMLRPAEIEGAVAEVVDYYREFSYSRYADGSQRQDFRAHSVFVEEHGQGARRHITFRVEMYQTPIEFGIPERLLTGSLTIPKEHYADVKWERQGNGRVKLLFEEWNFHELRRSRHDNKLGDPLWADEDLKAEFEKAMSKVREANALRSALQAKVDSGVASIKKQWNDFAYAATYARFLEDFMDPELWEGHLKHTKIPKWPHPSDTSVEHFNMPGQPRALIQSLVEHGLDPSGMTVAEAIELHRSAVGTWEEPGRWVPYGSGGMRTLDRSLTHTVDYTVEVPEDILNMTIQIEGPKEEEPEDDGWIEEEIE